MTLLLDGGLATTLQQWGLPPVQPVEPWVDAQPHRVLAAQRAFRDAGADLLLTATFRTWARNRQERDRARRAIRLARAAGHGLVYRSIGPLHAPGQAPTPAPLVEAARHAEQSGCDGVVLETFVDAPALLAAVEAIGAACPGLPIIASLCPAPDGRLYAGPPAAPWLERLHEAGAVGVGANCGSGPASIAYALDEADPAWRLWVKPNTDGLDPATFAAALAPLAAHATWLGGCCGASPAHIRALRTGLFGD